MWNKIALYGVGGLREIGFYKNTNLILVLSGQGRGLFDCSTGEKIARDKSDYYTEKWDSNTGIVEGIADLKDELIICGGFEYPDKLNKETYYGDKISIKKETRKIWNGSNAECEIIYIESNNDKVEVYFSAYGINRAFGFSNTGETFVMATSSDLHIWRSNKNSR